jgi:DNA-binding transcriptional LysR family regulator
VLARAHAAEAALTDLGTLRRGRLAIFASQTIASYWLPSRLVAFHARFPGVELDVSVGNTREAADAVLLGTAELGFVEGDVVEPPLEQIVVGVDRLVVAVPPGHAWAGKPRLTSADLRAAAWLLREPGSGTRSSLRSALASLGVDIAALTVAMTLPSNEALIAAAEAGAGATAVSESVAAAAFAAGRLVRAAVELPARDYRLLRHRERYRGRAGDAFVAGLATVRPVIPAQTAIQTPRT